MARSTPGHSHDTMVDDHEWLVLLQDTAMTRWSMTTNGSFYLRHGRDAIVDNANGLYYSGAASVIGLSAGWSDTVSGLTGWFLAIAPVIGIKNTPMSRGGGVFPA